MLRRRRRWSGVLLAVSAPGVSCYLPILCLGNGGDAVGNTHVQIGNDLGNADVPLVDEEARMTSNFEGHPNHCKV